MIALSDMMVSLLDFGLLLALLVVPVVLMMSLSLSERAGLRIFANVYAGFALVLDIAVIIGCVVDSPSKHMAVLIVFSLVTVLLSLLMVQNLAIARLPEESDDPDDVGGDQLLGDPLTN